MMSINGRLRICALVLILSAVYGVMVAKDPNIASAVAAGYCAVVLTAVIATQIWRKP